MSLGNYNVTQFNYHKGTVHQNYILNRQYSLPAIQVNQRGQRHVHLLPAYQQKLTYEHNLDSDEMAASGKTKHASLQIYRPPNLRAEAPSSSASSAHQRNKRLNVHAKEFFMASGGGGGGNKIISENGGSKEPPKPYPLSTSKSGGGGGAVSFNPSKMNSSQNVKSSLKASNSSSGYSLQKTKSSGMLSEDLTIPVNPQRVQFKMQIERSRPTTTTAEQSKPVYQIPEKLMPASSLKRSKSLNATDAFKFMEMEASLLTSTVDFTEYHLFPPEVQEVLKMAVNNANRLSDKRKIILARYVINLALKEKQFSFPVVKLSVIIIEKDSTGTYLDSLMNTCQMLYQKKDILLFNDTRRFNMFVTFLTEMHTELKRSKIQLKLQSDPGTPPKYILLNLICHCCEDILQLHEEHSLLQIECLFLALTSVGRDLELEMREPLEKLFCAIKQVFLMSADSPQIKKTLLQLIELRAANWQLPVSAISYYYPKYSN